MSFTAGAGTRFLVSTGASGTTPLSGPLSITGGTATANAPVLNATQTWNNAAVTFTGWQLNVTDTASNAASLLMDLQIGGVTRFGVSKSGNGVLFGAGGLGAGNITFGTSLAASNSVILRGVGSTFSLEAFSNVSVNINSGLPLGWATATYTSPDLQLWRDAANTLAQRNGINAQTLRVYNTFTDASNYERGTFGYTANVLRIGVEQAGTGTQRNLTLISWAGSMGFEVNGTLRCNITTTDFQPQADEGMSLGNLSSRRWLHIIQGAGYHQMFEMTAPAAPAANSVRIYAEDNGSGKTRLMALFATGAAQQIAIEP